MSSENPKSDLMSEAVRSDDFFESLLESAPDAMIIVDQLGKISIVNRQAERMFGYTRDQLLDESIELLVPERLRDVHAAERQGYLKTPRLRAMGAGRELFGRRQDGTEFPTEISLSPLRTQGGLYVSSVIRDITARKKMEHDIIAARQEAERANKANSAFLAAASHDLRQPVQALSLLSGALRRTVTDPKALEMVEIQSQSLTAMTNLLNSLLDISRLDAGAVSPKFEEFPISRLIERLSAEFGRQAVQKGLAFESTSCDAIVRSDTNLLSEIIQNLVSNGIRYTNCGSVRMNCNVEGDTCRVVVCDTGIGIEADQIEQIFTEFHQCNSSVSNKEGFGLGLAIVRRLADLLGHGIDVQSEPGKGSCFSVSVPIVVTHSGEASSEADTTVFLDREKTSGFILLIEDDTRVASALVMLLESAGYDVEVAVSKSDAIDALSRSDSIPSLILSDYHLMGEATGVDAIAALREILGKTVPAFIVTGDTSELKEEARSVPNSSIISKPVDPDRLLGLAKQAIRSGEVPE